MYANLRYSLIILLLCMCDVVKINFVWLMIPDDKFDRYLRAADNLARFD